VNAANPARRVVAVTGLASEARIASHAGVRTVVGAGDARRLALALEREIARGAKAIISFGVAGGLTEDSAPGQWIVARHVVARGTRWSTDRSWTDALAQLLPGALVADVAADDAIAAQPQQKRAWQRATGARAIDTESHVVAMIAATHGLPFAVFRVVADPVTRALPPAAMRALRRDGRVSGVAVCGSLLRAPHQLPALVRVAVDARAALRALSRGRRLLGPGLGYPNLAELVLDMA
jgi:hopanoid-associated phosphorylase